MGLESARGRAVRSLPRPFRRADDSAATKAKARVSVVGSDIAQLNLPGPKAELRFPVSAETRRFYKRFWPDTTAAEWNDWRWQMRSRIRNLEQLSRIFRLSEDEYAAVSRHQGALPVGITPYYASLMDL